jgi:hypothetical protein
MTYSNEIATPDLTALITRRTTNAGADTSLVPVSDRTDWLCIATAVCPHVTHLSVYIMTTGVGPHVTHLSVYNDSSMLSRDTPIRIYRVSQEECARLRENVPYVKLHRYNPKHLHQKLNGYGDNG